MNRRLFPVLFSGGAAAFTPTSIAGLKLWFDFSDITTLFQDSARTTAVTADAQVIGSATDKSLTANASQAGVDDLKPIYKENIQNGRGACLFDGVNSFLNITGVIQPFTLFIVIKLVTTGAEQNIVSGGGPSITRNRLVITLANKVQLIPPDNTTLLTSAGVLSTAAKVFTVTVGANPYPATMYINGLSSGGPTNVSGPFNAYSRLGIGNTGSTAPLGAYIGELLQFNSVLADPDITSIHTYLNARWNLY